MAALPPKADIRQRIEHVCFVPKADIRSYASLRTFPYDKQKRPEATPGSLKGNT